MRRVRNRRGGASLEMALVSPILLLLLAGTSDVVNYHRTHMRIETASALIAQVVSQCARITNTGDVNEFFNYGQATVGSLADLRSTTGNGAIIISAIGMVNNAARVRWQVRTGNPTQPSVFGVSGGPASLSGNMTFSASQTLFAVEVYGAANTYVLSRGFMGSMFGPLNGVTLLASRAADPLQLQSTPATSTSRDCTA